MSLKNVLIIGSTGNDKFDSINLLTSKESYETKKDKFAAFEKDGAKIVTVNDVTDVDELATAFKGSDVVISAVAIKAGVKRFYPSEFGGNPTGESAKAEINVPKVELRKYIEEKAAQNPSFSYTFFATYLFSDYLGGYGAPIVGVDLENHTITFIGDGSTRFSTTPLVDVGNYTVASVLDDTSSRNKTIEVQSQDISFAELKAIYEKIQGVNYTVIQTSIDEITNQYQEAKASGNIMGVMIGSLKISFYKGQSLNQAHDENLYPDVKPHTVEETLGPMLS